MSRQPWKKRLATLEAFARHRSGRHLRDGIADLPQEQLDAALHFLEGAMAAGKLPTAASICEFRQVAPAAAQLFFGD